MARFIFVTGGVVSSIGKGLTAASLGALLQARGYSVRLRKLDPYFNLDSGTMSPYEHGEVFVTEDGTETDLDLGHYERYTGVEATEHDSTSSGRIYSAVLEKERRGDYLGKTIQVIPHITDEIKNWLWRGSTCVDFMLCEIGGTAGDIEGLPFFEAARQFWREMPAGHCVFVHVTLLPYVAASGELKTKPTQHSVKELRSIGISPDVLVCRSERPLTEEQRSKISLFCNVRADAVISAVDLKSMYEAPVAFASVGLDRAVLAAVGISPLPRVDLGRWHQVAEAINGATADVRVAIVGKYVELEDAYKSVSEALAHGGIAARTRVSLSWVNSELLETHDPADSLADVDGILIPGGFGKRGTQGMINAVHYARECKIPFLGLCYGMHMAVIESVRRLDGHENAGSQEFDLEEDSPKFEHVVSHMKGWVAGDITVKREVSAAKGGTMRLGAYHCVLASNSKVANIYGAQLISERHRHRFEIDIAYRPEIEAGGLVISGVSPDGNLVEAVELPDHPWFVGVQFHPELKSKPFAPHPLFTSFVMATREWKSGATVNRAGAGLRECQMSCRASEVGFGENAIKSSG